MATVTIEFTLSRDSYNSIIEMAGYGVDYWASYMESTKKGCHFTEDRTGEKFFITPEALERALLELHTGASLNVYYMSAIRDLIATGETGRVGSDIADAIVQQACFGKVIYG